MNDKYSSPEVEFSELLDVFHHNTLLPELCQIIGSDNTRKLVQHLGGAKIRLPKSQQFTNLARNWAIWCRVKAGATLKSVAMSHNITEQRVWRIVNTIDKKIAKTYLKDKLPL